MVARQNKKGHVFASLPAFRSGISLTESYGMSPRFAVSGYYFSHPVSRYFGVAEIGRDQASDYAKRKCMTLEEAEKWLAPMAYDPEQ